MSTITRKPKRRQPQESGVAANEAQIQKVINKGGSIPSNDAQALETMVVNLRPPVAMIQRIDELVSQRPVKTSRHMWLMEAIVEKLERESK